MDNKPHSLELRFDSIFTRQHYIWLAHWAKTAALAVSDLDRNLMVSSLADHLGRENPSFDRIKFLKAAAYKHAEDKP